MELVNKKVLVVLCALCLTAAVAEGYLLYRSNSSQTRAKSLESQFIYPFGVKRNYFFPWDVLPENFMPKKFMKGWDDDSFFGNKFPGANFFEESFTLVGPKREDKGDRVDLTFDIKGHENGNFDVKVTGRQLTLTGKDDHTGNQTNDPAPSKKSTNGFWFWRKNQNDSLESKVGEPQMRNESHWSITQSFPLPDDVDAKNYSIERTDNQLTVVFKKVNVANSRRHSDTENL